MAEKERLTVQGRLKQTRRKLAALEYHEPLNADTLPLVDHLLGDLVATTESYASLQAKEESYSNELKAVRAQVIPLRKEASYLVNENNALHEAMIRKEDEVASRNRSFTLEERMLKNQLALAVDGCKERDACIIEIELKMKRLRDALRNALPPSVAAEEPLLVEMGEDPTGETSRNFRWSSAGWSSEGEGVEGGGEGTETQDRGYDAGTETISTTTLEAYQLEVEALKNSVENRDNEIARLCKQLDRLNGKVLNSATLHSTHDNNKSIIEQLHKQVDFLNSQLATREVQLRKAHSGLSELEIELSKAKVQADYHRKQLERHTQVDLALSVPRAAESLSQGAAEEERKEAAAEASLFTVTQECSSLLERVQQLEAELRHVRSVADESRDQVERAERRLKDQLEDIASLTTRAERSEANAVIKTRECISLTEQLYDVQGNIDEERSDLARELLKLRLINEQCEERIEDLQKQLSGYRNGSVLSQQMPKERDARDDEHFGLEYDAKRDHSSLLVELEAELLKQKSESRRLRSLIHAMEEGRESAAQTLGISKQQFQEARDAVIASEANSADLRNQISVQEHHVAYLEQKLRVQGEEREELLKKVRDAVEERSSALSRVAELNTRAAASDGVASLATQRMKDLSKQLDGTEDMLTKSQQRAEDLHGQLTALQALYANRVAEVRSASDDLNLLTKENHAMTADMGRLAAERETSSAEVVKLQKEVMTAQQAARGFSLEKDDILSAYRALFEERNHIESKAKEAAAANEYLSRNISELEGEVATARASISGAEIELTRRSHTIAALERHVGSLSNELQRSERRAEALKDENRQVRQEVESQRAHTGNVMDRIRVQQMTSAAAADELSSLRARIVVLEQERDSLSKILMAERAQGAGLEEMIQSGRSKDSEREAQLKLLEKDKALLESELVRLQHELNTTRGDATQTSSSNVSFSGVSLEDGKAGGSVEQEGREKRMATQNVAVSDFSPMLTDVTHVELEEDEVVSSNAGGEDALYQEGNAHALVLGELDEQRAISPPIEHVLSSNRSSAINKWDLLDLPSETSLHSESISSPRLSDTTES